MNFEKKATEIIEESTEPYLEQLGDSSLQEMSKDEIEQGYRNFVRDRIADALQEAHELGRSELNAHDKSRVKVLLELGEARARIEELELALDFYGNKDHWSPSAGGSWINSFNKKDFKEVWNEEKSRWEAPYGYKARAALAKRGKGE
jgi:hypothetical protein